MNPAVRIGATTLVGALISVYMLLAVRQPYPLGNTDFDQVWYAGRVAIQDADPYVAIAARRPATFGFPYYYPGTTTLLGLPFTAFPDVRAARLAMALLSGGLLGFAIGRYRPHLWPALLSAPFISSGHNVQWAPLLTAGMLMPGLGWLAAAKPNLGVAMLLGSRTWRQVAILVGGGLLVVIFSLAVDPEWPWGWRDTLSQSQHFKPLLLRPGGFLVLLALWRWRDPSARLLLGLGVVPTSGLFYDALPALLTADTRYQAAAIALLSLLARTATGYATAGLPFRETSWIAGTFVLWGVILPALGLVLWRRRP